MKKILILLALLSTIFQKGIAQQEKQLIIKGDVSRVKEHIEQVKIYVGKAWDSCKVVNGKYSFNIKSHKPSAMVIDFCPKIGVFPLTRDKVTEKYRHRLYLEPGVVIITCIDSLFTCKTEGSKYNLAFQDFSRKRKARLDLLNSIKNEIEKAERDNDTTKSKSLRADYRIKYDGIDTEFCCDYALSNSNSPILFYILKEAAGYPFNAERVKPVFKKLPKHIQQSTKGKDFIERIGNSFKVGIGKMAPTFTQADTSGNLVNLSDFRGKYVLLEFWGSWCVFCRLETPNMLQAFKNYKDKGFTILSVAADDSKKKWMDAIHEDKTGVWTHISDLKGSSNGVAKLYNVTGYPTNYLIDPDGKIIAENLRGKALEKKLLEVVR